MQHHLVLCAPQQIRLDQRHFRHDARRALRRCRDKLEHLFDAVAVAAQQPQRALGIDTQPLRPSRNARRPRGKILLRRPRQGARTAQPGCTHAEWRAHRIDDHRRVLTRRSKLAADRMVQAVGRCFDFPIAAGGGGMRGVALLHHAQAGIAGDDIASRPVTLQIVIGRRQQVIPIGGLHRNMIHIAAIIGVGGAEQGAPVPGNDEEHATILFRREQNRLMCRQRRQHQMHALAQATPGALGFIRRQPLSARAHALPRPH